MDTQKNEKSEMMLKNINKFVEYSCQLENEREKSLTRQSGLMIISIAIMSTVILKSGSIEFNFLNCCSEILLIVSLLCSLLTGWRYKSIDISPEKSKKAINDKRARFLNFSCVCLFISVVLYFISFDIIYAIRLIKIPR